MGLYVWIPLLTVAYIPYEVVYVVHIFYHAKFLTYTKVQKTIQ